MDFPRILVARPRQAFGLTYRDITKNLRERGCEVIRKARNGREVWATPKGVTFGLNPCHAVVGHKDAMRMNHVLRGEMIPEIRPNSQAKKKRPPDIDAPPEPRKSLRDLFYERIRRLRHGKRKIQDNFT